MPFINWSQNLETGIDTVDKQHRVLLDILNNVHAAMVNGNEQVINSAFQCLMEYTEFHFAHEEELFTRFKYPFAAAHRREHAKLKSDAESRIREYHTGSLSMMDILAFLIDWLQDHISASDKKFGDFVRMKQ